MLVLSVIVIIFSMPLTYMFGQGEDIAIIVEGFFRILSVGYVLDMVTSCFQGYITGLGKPGLAMILLIIYYLVIRIPAAYEFEMLWSLNGVWCGFLLSHIVAVIAAFAMYSYCNKTDDIRLTACTEDL